MTIADIFRHFQSLVWEDGFTRAFDDACEVAHAMGGKVTADDGEEREYLFPDGSTATVIVKDGRGSGVA